MFPPRHATITRPAKHTPRDGNLRPPRSNLRTSVATPTTHSRKLSHLRPNLRTPVAIPTTHCRKFVTPIKPANLRRHTGDALSQVRHPDQTCEPPSPYRRRTVASSAPRSNLRTSVAVSTTGCRRFGRLVR